MVFAKTLLAKRANANAPTAGLGHFVTSVNVILVALRMASVSMALVTAKRVGWANIALSVRKLPWRKRHCTPNLYSTPTDGCPNLCSKHGRCVSISSKQQDLNLGYGSHGGYRCQCTDGWGGPDCSAPQEINCADEIDNDNG